jgi:hypothetical protein
MVIAFQLNDFQSAEQPCSILASGHKLHEYLTFGAGITYQGIMKHLGAPIHFLVVSVTFADTHFCRYTDLTEF